MTRPFPPRRIRRDSPQARAELRERIIAVAFEIFRTEGEEAVTMRAISEQVGVSQMALYGYFSDKAHLLRSMSEILFAEVVEQLLEATAGRRSARTRLLAIVDGWLAYWEANPQNYRLVYLSRDETPPGEQREYFAQAESYLRMCQMLYEAVAAYARELGLPATRVRLAADVMLCYSIGYLHGTLTVTRYPWSPRPTLRRAVCETLLQSAHEVLGSRWPMACA